MAAQLSDDQSGKKNPVLSSGFPVQTDLRAYLAENHFFTSPKFGFGSHHQKKQTSLVK